MRADALGLFWQDMPKLKLPKEDEKFLPPDPTWLANTFLPYLEEAKAFDLPMMSDTDLIAAYENKNRFVFDIESYHNYFLIAFKDIVTGKIIYFERIGTPEGDTEWNDDPRKLIWIMNNITIVGFNSNNYDIPIAILAMANKSVAQMKAATNMIIGEGYKPWQVLKKLKLKKLENDHIDIMEVAPLRGSLKILGGRAGTRKMQDLPIHPEVELTEDQITVTRYYCVNDLDTTHDLHNKLVKDIVLREKMSTQYGIDLRSKSDAQIAEAVIAHELEKVLGHRPSKPVIDPGTAYKYQIPEWMSFQTPMMQGVLKVIANTLFIVNEKGSIGLPPQLANTKIRIADGLYKMGIGGLHSTEKKTTHFTDQLFQLSDHDVTSYYPFIILNNNLFPKHLGPLFLQVFRTIVFTRLDAKEQAGKYYDLYDAESDPIKRAEFKRLADEYQGTADSLKIVINGTFGKLGSVWSIFYAPDLLIQTTLTGQLALLMLIEQFELHGIPVVSANTDGVVIRCPRSKFSTRDAILDAWQKQTNFNLEANFYKTLCSKDVNNYFAVTEKGKVKGKGAYSDPGLRKNPTTTICAKAVSEFLKNGTPVEATISACKDVKEFVTIRGVNGGGVEVTYEDKGERGKVKTEAMEQHLIQTGWCKHGLLWVKKQWTIDGKNLDKMAINVSNAYAIARWQPIDHNYLGKAVRWYYAKVQEGFTRRIIYAKNGNKVPKSDGAKQLMELPNSLPKDLDFDWYVNEANRILKDVGYPV